MGAVFEVNAVQNQLCNHDITIANSLTSTLLSAMHTLFLFNYIRVSLNVFQLSDTYLVTSHCILLVTSQLTMMIVARFRDNTCFRRETHRIVLCSGIVYGVSYALFWCLCSGYLRATSGSVLLCYAVCLCVYDGAYIVLVEVLREVFEKVAEMQKQRARITHSAQKGTLIGSG